MQIEINVIKTFVLVVELGSVRAAARERGYSPAAVSRQMTALQRRLGVRLFAPHGRSIRPTTIGRELLKPARDLLLAADLFDQFANRLYVSAPAADGENARSERTVFGELQSTAHGVG